MDINELLKEEIKNSLNDIETEVVNYIFNELEKNQYMHKSTMEENTLQKIDEELGV